MKICEIGILFWMIVSLTSCKEGISRQGEDAVAKVGNKYLYISDLPVLPGTNISTQDSIQIQNSFIEKWAKNQLLLQKAELNLPQGDQDVNEQLEEYRESLLIYKYQQMLLKQQLDTIVTTEQVEEYYARHNQGFLLNKPALRGIFMRIPRPAPDLDKVRMWCKSEKPDALKALESYCLRNAARCELSPKNWISFETIQVQMPSGSGFGDWVLRSYKFYETQDTNAVYLLSIRDFRLAGAPTPVEIVHDNIRNILLNKRKIDFLMNIENDLYSNAISRNQVEYFKK